MVGFNWQDLYIARKFHVCIIFRQCFQEQVTGSQQPHRSSDHSRWWVWKYLLSVFSQTTFFVVFYFGGGGVGSGTGTLSSRTLTLWFRVDDIACSILVLQTMSHNLTWGTWNSNYSLHIPCLVMETDTRKLCSDGLYSSLQ
jgi:hypothetical protein